MAVCETLSTPKIDDFNIILYIDVGCFLLLTPKFWTPQTLLIVVLNKAWTVWTPVTPGLRHEVRVSPLMASRSLLGKRPRRWLGLLQRWALSPDTKKDHSMPPIFGGNETRCTCMVKLFSGFHRKKQVHSFLVIQWPLYQWFFLTPGKPIYNVIYN